MAKTQWKTPHFGAGAGILVLGLIAGRAFFPLEIPRPFVVEKEKRVEVPVDRVVIQKEPFEVIKYVDRIVEKKVEVPVERIVEKRVEVPVERVVYRDRTSDNKSQGLPADRLAWRQLSKGMSREQVRSILGEPRKIDGGVLENWYYGPSYYSASVTFYNSRLDSWSEP
jgi:hypothetical protein